MTNTALSPNRLQDTATAKTFGTDKRRTLAALGFTPLNEWMDNGPGRNPKYSRSSMLKGVLLCIDYDVYRFKMMEKVFQTTEARRLCGFDTETPVASTIWRFWNRVFPFLPRVFNHITRVLDTLDLYGETFAIDSTRLESDEDDPDGVWAWDENVEENFYYGYGLLVAVDCASDLPAGAVFCQRKQHDEETTLECLEQLTANTDVETVLGDAGYDALETHEECLDREILPICTFNPRNTGEEYDYRIEKLVDQGEVDEEVIEDVDLDTTFHSRQAAERLFSLLKGENGEIEFRVQGWNRVGTHVFLLLIDRLITGLAKWQSNPNTNLRTIR